MSMPPLLQYLEVPSSPEWIFDWEALDARFEWIQAMRGTQQDATHHAEGDVWIHTRMVAEEMAKLDAFRKSGDRDRALAFASALLHDAGKPMCTRLTKDGRITSKGHSAKGAHFARRFLWRAGMPFADRESVFALIMHHQVPFWLFDRDEPFELVSRISQKTRCDHLALLAEADARGRTCDDQARILENIALFREYCIEKECFTSPYLFPSAHARFLWFGEKQRDPRHKPHEEFRCEVTLMSGFPGAGKDRWIRDNIAKDVPVVSLDQLRHDLEVAPEERQGIIVQAARDEARAHLRAGTSFVWNATNISKRVRGQCIRLFTDYGAKVRIVYVEVPETTLRAQNRSRPSPVPEHVLDELIDRRWEVPDVTEAHEVTYAIRSAA